jgi:hypothetical protein
VTVTLASSALQANLETILARGFPAVAQQRSLDPLTPLVTELLTVAAEVAIDEASGAAVEQLRAFLKTQVCDELAYQTLGVPAEYSAQPSAVSTKFMATQSAEEAPLPDAGVAGAASEDDDETDRLLPRTCDVIQSVRLEEIAASATLIQRALASDFLAVSFAILQNGMKQVGNANPSEVKPIRDALRAVEHVLASLIDGRAVSSERDVQLLLLNIAQVGINDTEAEESWRCGVEAGWAVLAECLQQGGCTADRLRNALRAEFVAASPPCKAALLSMQQNWPELPSLVARSADVFQPPPGTSPNKTAKVAINVVLEIADHVLQSAKPTTTEVRNARRALQAARSLVNAILENDLSEALVQAGSYIANVTDDTDGDRERAFALLNGFVSYAASYTSKQNGTDGNAQANREELKLRHEQRKLAMESLIDSLTDRSYRSPGSVVFSAGATVSAVAGWQRYKIHNENFGQPGEDKDSAEDEWVPAVSLPTGFALEVLPNENNLGFHLQLPLLDIAQFANVTDSELAEPEVATAAYFGVTAAMLIGSRTQPFLIGATGGYAPGMRFSDDVSHGVIRAGVIAGTYVPFIDF